MMRRGMGDWTVTGSYGTTKMGPPYKVTLCWRNPGDRASDPCRYSTVIMLPHAPETHSVVPWPAPDPVRATAGPSLPLAVSVPCGVSVQVAPGQSYSLDGKTIIKNTSNFTLTVKGLDCPPPAKSNIKSTDPLIAMAVSPFVSFAVGSTPYASFGPTSPTRTNVPTTTQRAALAIQSGMGTLRSRRRGPGESF